MGNVSFHVSPELIWRVVHAGWTVVAGMVALYFYGRYHFNTPDYSLDLALGTDPPAASGAQLITPAPPIFTTNRARYNRYVNLYVLILEAAFIGFIFLYSVFSDSARILQFKLPDLTAESLQFRAVLALFALTGLLSSFPMFKEVDIWLLTRLHAAALIPDEARLLAGKLYSSKFRPTPDAVAVARAALTMRDTARVADGLASGSLERRIFALLCLRAQIQTSMADDEFESVKVKLDRDFKAIASRTQGLESELKAYLRHQERIVPPTTADIDLFIANNSDDAEFAELAKSREELQAKCERVYEILCLVIALSLFATQFTSEDMDAVLAEMGFPAKVDPTPVFDWDTVFKVTISTFVLTLAFNGIYVLFIYAAGLSSRSDLLPDKPSIVRFAILYTIVYAIVMWMAIRLKRYWRRKGLVVGHLPENFLIAIYGYVATVPVNLIIGVIFRGWVLTWAPFLFALNQAIFGYFIGKYIDRSNVPERASWLLALLHGACQAVGAAIAVGLSLSFVNGFTAVLIGTFSVFQAAISGFIVGALFQHFYKRTSVARRSGNVDGARDGDAPASDMIPIHAPESAQVT